MFMVSPELLVALIALHQRLVESAEIADTKSRLPDACGDHLQVVTALAY
jgi:hypothetical protein